MLVEEYDRFTNAGPRGLLNAFHLLKESGKLQEVALVIRGMSHPLLKLRGSSDGLVD